MDSIQFIRTLQLSDSFFPVGAFAYSDGLETATTSGLVRDAVSLGKWMDHYLDNVFVPCEGLALVKAMLALKKSDIENLISLDEELSAIRTSRAGRAASSGVGKRLLSVCSEFTSISLPQSNAAIAYAVVFFRSGVDEKHAALAYGYNRLTGIVSCGLRLISMGQQLGQELLTRTLERLPDAVDRILQTTNEPLRSFSPLLDIQQMNHQYVYSRLFRS